MARILVLDAYWHKTLAAIRCLGQQNHRVYSGEMTPWSVALFSCYVSKPFFIYPSPQRETSAFLKALCSFVSKHKIEVVLAMEESTLLLLLQHKESLPQVCLMEASLEQILWARDKKNVLEAATKLPKPIPIPKTIAPENLEEAKEALEKGAFPLLLKPRIGTGASGITRLWQQEKAWEQYQKLHQKYPLPLIQDLLPPEGEGLGVSFFFAKGECLAQFTHRRLREPLYGGSGTLRISERFPEQEEQAYQLLKQQNWTGVAMVEFKKDTRTGQFCLMEVNPRFWGSLALAIYAGIPFPELLVRFALKQELPKLEQKNGIKARWLLPGDFLIFWERLNRGVWDKEFFLLFKEKLFYDICSWKDPLPILGRLTSFGPYLFSPDFAHLRNR